MWNTKGDLIQVEIGAGLVQRYSSKGFFGTSNNDGKQLLNVFSAMRERLKEENIIVPQIQCRDDNSLGRDEFVVYVGAEFYRSNIRENEIADVIEFFVRRYQMESASKDTIHKYIFTANEYISQQRYADGLRYLDTAYFWSNLLEGCDEEAVDTILQIGRILIQNHDMFHAQLCAQRADFITSQPHFYNPYLKCASDEFSGSIYMINKDFSAADQAYTSAFNKIANVAEANLLKIGVLAANLQALQFCEDYVKANQITQILIDVLAQSGCPDLMPMYKFKNHIANCAIERLGAENAQLRRDKQLLIEKYNEVMEKLRFREQFKGVVIKILQCAICILPALSGSLTTHTSQEPCTRIYNFNIGKNNQISVTMNYMK